MSKFHDDLAGRISMLLDAYTPDTDPAIWAVRACGVVVNIIGNENVDFEEVRTVLETLYVLAPDPIIEATATMNKLSQGDFK